MTIEPPKEKPTDKILNLAKATINQIPGAEIVVEMLSCFAQSPYQKRVEKWQQDISEVLNYLLSKQIDLEQLQNNPEFFDSLLKAIKIGIENHQEEKRQYLKNALINIAMNNAPKFTLQQIFLNCIANFTVDHIRLLLLLNNPKAYSDKIFEMRTFYQLIQSVHPEWKEFRLIEIFWQDLHSHGLVWARMEQTVLTKDELETKRTTLLGEEFIKFIMRKEEL